MIVPAPYGAGTLHRHQNARVELVAAILLATFVGPYLIGWWIGHPGFAAAAWGALGLTVLIAQLRYDTSEPLMFLWIAVAGALSAGSAWYGALRRERKRKQALERS